MNSSREYPPTKIIYTKEMNEVNMTQAVADAVALEAGTPISNHNGVKMVPPPSPTKPPRKPAKKLALTV